MKPSIVFFTDFGLDSGFVSSMHGVCKQVDPTLELSDGSHLIKPFNVRHASSVLSYTVPYWPEGTVFVCVVDPGVGTQRKASVAKLKNGSYIVTPDNGTLTLVDEFAGISEIREIDQEVHRFPSLEEVDVFHGRDVFAYTAAKLASAKISYEDVGTQYPVEAIVRYPVHPSCVTVGRATGFIEEFDPFGTAQTNIRNEDFKVARFERGQLLRVTIEGPGLAFDEHVLYGKTFGDVEVGQSVLFNDLAFHVALGINQGSFQQKYRLREDTTYSIEISQGCNVTS